MEIDIEQQQLLDRVVEARCFRDVVTERYNYWKMMLKTGQSQLEFLTDYERYRDHETFEDKGEYIDTEWDWVSSYMTGAMSEGLFRRWISTDDRYRQLREQYLKKYGEGVDKNPQAEYS